MLVSIIAAVAENGVIGRGGELPWHLSNDLRRFKQLTMGHTVIMGRRTWESIGRALPGRTMIVVSRQSKFYVKLAEVRVASSLDGALQFAASENEEEAFIIGGAELYRAALPLANRLYLTRVHAEVEGDTFFPEVPWDEWRQVESCDCEPDENNDHFHTLQVYDRVP